MSSWSCPNEERGLCNKVARAYCRPGMKGCVLVGKVTFQDGTIPDPVWPDAHPKTAPAPQPAPALGPEAEPEAEPEPEPRG